MQPHEEIFRPILGARSGHLWTWNIADPYGLPSLAAHLHRTGPWSIVVGYSKATHCIGKLVNVLKSWHSVAPDVALHLSVNMHLKVWALNTGLWVGSTNLVQSTILNAMFCLPEWQAERVSQQLEKIVTHRMFCHRSFDLLKAMPTREGMVDDTGMVMDLGRDCETQE